MSSLKGYIPALSRILGTTPAALYERQRALVRSGLIAAGDGRGPGSGVRATSPSVALLIIAVLVTDSLSETSDLTAATAGATTASEIHPFKEMRTFANALAFILTSKAWAAKLREVSIVRTHGTAAIKYRDSGKDRSIEFAIRGHKPTGVLRIEASISADGLRDVSQDVMAIVAAAPAPPHTGE